MFPVIALISHPLSIFRRFPFSASDALSSLTSSWRFQIIRPEVGLRVKVLWLVVAVDNESRKCANRSFVSGYRVGGRTYSKEFLSLLWKHIVHRNLRCALHHKRRIETTSSSLDQSSAYGSRRHLPRPVPRRRWYAARAHLRALIWCASALGTCCVLLKKILSFHGLNETKNVYKYIQNTQISELRLQRSVAWWSPVSLTFVSDRKE